MCVCFGMASRLRTCFKLEQVCVFVFGHGQPAAHVLQARAGVCVFVFGHGQLAVHVLQAKAGVCVCVCVCV